MALLPYYKQLYDKLQSHKFVTDKSGVKTVEIIAPRIVFPDPTEELVYFNEDIHSPVQYLEKEYDWYMSKDLNIDKVKDVEIWRNVADVNGEVNSNYGNLVFSRNNFSQFEHAKRSLINNSNSRQAIVIYNRPSIHLEYNSVGASDFICTMYQHFLIRDDELVTITTMRSNDARFGTMNDIPWFHGVIKKMHVELKKTYPELMIGQHIFIPDSFHLYERHFPWLTKLIGEFF